MPFTAASPAAAEGNRARRVRRVVERRCVICRRSRPREQLWRVARQAAGEIRFDPEVRLQGRGAYVCRAARCAAAAAADPKPLARALRAAPPAAVLDQLARCADAPPASPCSSDRRPAAG